MELGFRTHFLIPNKIVSAVTPTHSLPNNIHVENHARSDVYFLDEEPIFEVSRSSRGWSLWLFKDMWLQEPGITAKLDGFSGEAWIKGYNSKTRKATSPVYHMTQKDAHKSTVHFSRYKKFKYTDSILVHRPDRDNFFLRSDGGFSKLLDDPRRIKQGDWDGCKVSDRGWSLTGFAKGFEMLRRWEAAGFRPDIVYIHTLGWTGGAGCVTDRFGRDSGGPANSYLWQPRSWRFLPAHRSIVQRIWTT